MIYDKVEAVCKEIYPDMYGQAFFERLDMTRFDHLFFKDFGEPNDQLKHGDIKTLKLLVKQSVQPKWLNTLSCSFDQAPPRVATTLQMPKDWSRMTSGAPSTK